MKAKLRGNSAMLRIPAEKRQLHNIPLDREYAFQYCENGDLTYKNLDTVFGTERQQLTHDFSVHAKKVMKLMEGYNKRALAGLALVFQGNNSNKTRQQELCKAGVHELVKVGLFHIEYNTLVRVEAVNV